MKIFFAVLVTLSLVYLTSAQGSWQGYVDDQLVGAGMKDAAIIGNDGETWATSPGLYISKSQGTTLVNLFKTPSTAFSNGVTIGEVKFIAIKSDYRSIYGKKGAGGVILVKTAQTIIIGIYDETMQPGNAANVVEKLGDYLIENGY